MILPIRSRDAPATRKHLSENAVENRSQRGVCKHGWGQGRAVHQSRVSKFMFFKIKARRMPCGECSGQSSVQDRVSRARRQPRVHLTPDTLWACFLLASSVPFVLIDWDFSSSLWLTVFTVGACGVASGAAAVVHHHRGDLPVDDLFLAIEVQHVDGRHLGGRAAGPCGAPRIGLVHQVCVWVLLQVQELALPRAVVGPVALGRDDPVPSKLLKVNCERVPAAARFC